MPVAERAAERLSQTPSDPSPALEQALAEANAELARLATAIAKGGHVDALLAAVREREQKREHLEAQLAACQGAVTGPALSGQKLRAKLRARLVEWRDPLTQHVSDARQILRKGLVGRLTITPDSARGEALIQGQGAITKLLNGIVSPKVLASPAGLALLYQVQISGEMRRAA